MELKDLLREAFEAGQQNASEYYHGGRGYHPEFNKWYTENVDEREPAEFESVKLWNKDKEIESQRYELFHLNAQLQDLFTWIKAESTYRAFRYMDKNPSAFDLNDDEYMNLYLLCLELRKKDKEEIEARNDAFDQTLP
jgi:hypothetical protein